MLIVDSADEVLLGRLQGLLIQGTRDDAAKNGRPDPVTSRQVRGVTVWTFDGKAEHAIFGKRLLLASTAGAGAAVGLSSRTRTAPPSTALAATRLPARRREARPWPRRMPT